MEAIRACSEFNDCFNCTVTGTCMWSNDKCIESTYAPDLSAEVLEKDQVTQSVSGDDDFHTYYDTLHYPESYGKGNTYSVMMSSK